MPIFELDNIPTNNKMIFFHRHRHKSHRKGSTLQTTVFAIVAVATVFLPDIYIWDNYIRNTTETFGAIMWWTPASLIVCTMLMWKSGRWHNLLLRTFFGLALCTVLPKLIFTIISVVGRGLATVWSPLGNVADIAAVVIAYASLCAFAYGLTIGWRKLTIKEDTLTFDNLPKAFDGYKILQFSDLHVGTFRSDKKFVKKLVKAINSQNADLIVFTGDLVNVHPGELHPYLNVLNNLHARDGIYSILGNHDYCEYRHYRAKDGASKNVDKLKKMEMDFGWNLLLNEFTTIERDCEKITLIGVENYGKPPFKSYSDLAKAMDGTDKEGFKILLSHDPAHWNSEITTDTDIDLTLSGHTHAMQLRIGRFSPAKWSSKEWGGIYRKGRQVLCVSSGIGGTMPFRLGAWPEINVITLKRSI